MTADLFPGGNSLPSNELSTPRPSSQTVTDSDNGATTHVNIFGQAFRRGSLVIVGQTNPYGVDPRYALYPYPMGSAGGRLMALASDAGGCHLAAPVPRPWAWIAFTDRWNLCAGPWKDGPAREAAAPIREALAGRPCVLLGSRVAAAWYGHTHCGPPPLFNVVDLVVTIPHTSGRNRAWHDAATYKAARLALADAIQAAQVWSVADAT